MLRGDQGWTRGCAGHGALAAEQWIAGAPATPPDAFIRVGSDEHNGYESGRRLCDHNTSRVHWRLRERWSIEHCALHHHPATLRVYNCLFTEPNSVPANPKPFHIATV